MNEELLLEAPPDDEQLQTRTHALTDHTWAEVWKGPFLRALSMSPNVSGAARQAGISRQYAYRIRKDDPVFLEAWEEAVNIAVDRYYQILVQRSTVGETRTTTKTRVLLKEGAEAERETVTIETTYVSDNGLIALLKAHRPEQFRERFEHRHTGGDGGPIEHRIFREPTHERMLELAKIAQELEDDDIIEVEPIEEEDVL